MKPIVATALQPSLLEQEKIAQALLSMDVIRVSEQHPFFYTSGWASPVYVDVRQLLSHVSLRTELIRIATSLVSRLMQTQHIDGIVGTEGSGVVFAAWLADRLQLPMLYLRRRPIGWGHTAHIEGELTPKAKLLLVDDVTTDGRSKIDACLTLQKLGAQSCDALVWVNFDIYPQTQQLLQVHNIALHSLITWPVLCKALFNKNQLTAQQRLAIDGFNNSPVHWSLKHGGIGA